MRSAYAEKTLKFMLGGAFGFGLGLGLLNSSIVNRSLVFLAFWALLTVGGGYLGVRALHVDGKFSLEDRAAAGRSLTPQEEVKRVVLYVILGVVLTLLFLP